MIQALKTLWKGIYPTSRPCMPLGKLLAIAVESDVKIEKEVCIIGIRGFYNKGSNKRSIYDDAIFILAPSGVMAFNANTDPGKFQNGIASLNIGTWLYRIGIHGLSKPKKDQYQALVQADTVVVTRDEEGLDHGWFGINIHKGGYGTVSSLGCQTIQPDQWKEFIDNVEKKMRLRDQKTIKYILKEMKDEYL